MLLPFFPLLVMLLFTPRRRQIDSCYWIELDYGSWLVSMKQYKMNKQKGCHLHFVLWFRELVDNFVFHHHHILVVEFFLHKINTHELIVSILEISIITSIDYWASYWEHVVLFPTISRKMVNSLNAQCTRMFWHIVK